MGFISAVKAAPTPFADGDSLRLPKSSKFDYEFKKMFSAAVPDFGAGKITFGFLKSLFLF